MSSRRNKGGGGHGGGGEERWLLPYADMITLLLGLFIVLFAMSSIDSKQFDNVKRSLSQTFNGAVLTESGGVLSGSEGALDPSAPSAQTAPAVISMERAVQQSESRFDDKKRQLEKLAEESGLGNDVKVTRNELGITINLAGDALFDSGSYELKPNVADKLVAIERELARFRHPILITGHTDKVGGFASNLELGHRRATAVWSLFLDKEFDVTRMRVETGGEAYPIDPSTPDGVSNSRNRRIEITVLAPGGESPVPKPVAVKRAASVTETPVPGIKATPVKSPGNPVGGAVEREIGTGIVQELAQTSKAGA